jgi:hypothetical protein
MGPKVPTLISPISPAAETEDLKSFQGQFESDIGYLQILLNCDYGFYMRIFICIHDCWSV